MTRLGIDDRWLPAWSRQSAFAEQSWYAVGRDVEQSLELYAATGSTGRTHDHAVDECSPPEARWEPFLPGDLRAWAGRLQFKFERTLADHGEWNASLAAQIFAAHYTSQMIEFFTHAMFPERFKGRNLQMLSLRDVAMSALGLIAVSDPRAVLLARLQVRAFSNGYYYDDRSYPIFAFMLRIMADFLGEPPIALSEKQGTEASLVWLGENWRSPWDGSFEDACLEACDFHTWRSAPTKIDFHEFDTGEWMRIPIEILLLFKLREGVGLSNSRIVHPLFDRVPGPLPSPTGFNPDVLVEKVRARMSSHGYDEAAIARMYE